MATAKNAWPPAWMITLPSRCGSRTCRSEARRGGAAGMDDCVAKPVRLEDLRIIVERWGEAATRTEPAVTAESRSQPSETANSPGQASTAAAAPEYDPVNMSRLPD